MIFSIIAFACFLACFLVVNTVSTGAETLALKITLHADAEAGIPPVDRNGNKWSVEQLNVLRAFAKAIYEHKNGGDPISIAVSAVAGSGKTSLLQGMTHIVAKLAPELLTAMTAFNTHIAKSSKDILVQFKSTDGLNIKIFGGSNTVNAAGHSMLIRRANAEGWDRINLKSWGDDRYVRIARLTLAGWLAREDEHTFDRHVLLDVAQAAMEVKTTSHAFNDMIGDLVKACQIVMDEGFIPLGTARIIPQSSGGFVLSDEVKSMIENQAYIPPTVYGEDVKLVSAIINEVGANQSWNDNAARNLGDVNVFKLVVEILSVAIETAFEKIELRPYCGDGKSFMDAIVPNKNQRGWWEKAEPMRRLIKTTNPDTVKKAQFAILETGGCRFPPVSKDNKKGVNAVSFDTEKKAIVRKHNDNIVFSFENGGHLKKIGGKSIGSQFGRNGNFKVDGENISTWRTFRNGLSIIEPGCVEKVIAFLSEQFGDEFENQLDDDSYVASEVVSGGKGELILSMADQIYLPHAYNLQIPDHEKADVAMIDEVQDLSQLKAQLVWRLVKEDAHKVIVGDLRQAIYLFAGASSQAFEDNAEAIGAEFYPQTICWRGTAAVAASVRYACAVFGEVVKKAYPNVELPDYQAHRSPLEADYDWWAEGALPVQITADEIVEAYHTSRELHGEDTTFGLLCRIKKPLATFIKTFLKNGIPVSTPATVGGSTGLVDEAFSSANKSRSKGLDERVTPNAKAMLGLGWNKKTSATYSQLFKDIEGLKSIAIGKFSDMFKGDRKSMAQATEFQEFMGNMELLEAFVSLHQRDANSNSVDVDGNVSQTIHKWVENSLFSERGGSAVHIGSIHRYKGDEADVMFIVNSYIDSASFFDDDSDEQGDVVECFMSERSIQASAESAVNELNMAYVGFSRAKLQNIIINASVPFENDVVTRLTGAFERDEDKMWSQGDSQPQNPKESDSEGDSPDHSDTDCPSCGVNLLKDDMGAVALHSHHCELSDEEARRITKEANVGWEKPTDLERCVECSTIITEDEEHGVCCECGGKLCRVRLPTHSKSGKYKKHMGGEINQFQSCGSVVGNITLDEMMNNSQEELEGKRRCKHCEGEPEPQIQAKKDFLLIEEDCPRCGRLMNQGGCWCEDEDCDDQECVLIEWSDGSSQRISLEDFDQLETDNPNFDGIKRASHLSEDEVQGIYFERTEPKDDREEGNVQFTFESISLSTRKTKRDTCKESSFKLVMKRSDWNPNHHRELMTYRYVEDKSSTEQNRIIMKLKGEGFFWKSPPKDHPLEWMEDTMLHRSKISQTHAVFWNNKHNEEIEDIHDFVVELFKEWVHTSWDSSNGGYWIGYDVDSDDLAMGLPKAIDILLGGNA